MAWVVYFDDSFTSNAAEGGVVLVTTEGDELEYAIRFGFKVTKNEAEYETMLAGLHLTHTLGAKWVRVNDNS